MTAQRGVLILLAFASSVMCACRTGEDDCTGWSSRSLEPGERPQGIDPNTVFDIYNQTWTGLIHWRTGETSNLTLTQHFEASQPVKLTLRCGKPGRLDRSLAAELQSDDGLLANMEMGVSVRFAPDGPAFDPPDIFRAELALGPRGDETLAGLADIEDFQLKIDLAWSFDPILERATAPDRGMIRAIRASAGLPSGTESIEVAAFTFQGT